MSSLNISDRLAGYQAHAQATALELDRATMQRALDGHIEVYFVSQYLSFCLF
jgi:hypothetical protein